MKRYKAAEGLGMDLRVLSELLTTSGDLGQDAKEIAQRVRAKVDAVEDSLAFLAKSGLVVEVKESEAANG